MASNAKKGYAHRFDFGDHHDHSEAQDDTIRSLLAEINLQHPLASGVASDLKSLGVTLRFLGRFTGRKYKSVLEKLPLSTLKTIKLLYTTNGAKDIQLFKLIEPPHTSKNPTMESATGTSMARDKYGAQIIQTLLDSLAKEIDHEKLNSFDAFLNVKERQTAAQGLNAHIEQTNDNIYQLLTRSLQSNNLALANAYYRIARNIDSARYKKVEGHHTPVHESVFTHLTSLGFVHFALHHRKFINEIRVTHPINSIGAEADALCLALSKSSDTTMFPDKNIFSVNNFHHLVAGYPNEISSLVHAATNLRTKKKTLFENTLRARKILIMHGLRCYDEADLDAPILSLYDIVAALCSVRYQQKVKTRYAPKWTGQVSQGKDPQRHFDRISKPSDLYQHQGVTQIYLYRFSEYRASFTKTMESFEGWMAYQVSRFDAYVRILQLNDIKGIIASSLHFDEFCLQEAESIVDAYGHSTL